MFWRLFVKCMLCLPSFIFRCFFLIWQTHTLYSVHFFCNDRCELSCAVLYSMWLVRIAGYCLKCCFNKCDIVFSTAGICTTCTAMSKSWYLPNPWRRHEYTIELTRCRHVEQRTSPWQCNRRIRVLSWIWPYFTIHVSYVCFFVTRLCVEIHKNVFIYARDVGKLTRIST